MKHRILIVRLGAMGDIIHALPAVASLKQSFPHSFLAWAVDPKWRPLLEGNPFVDELIPVDRKSFKSLLALRRELRAMRFDLALDIQGLIKSALIASAARPERIYGFDRTQVREKLAALIYSHPVRTRSEHVVDKNLEIAQAAGATNLVRSFWIPEGRPEAPLPRRDYVLANPLAGWTGKQWPLENYSELGRRLDEECGLDLVLNAAEPPSVPGTVAHSSGLPGLIDATRRAAGVVGVDSGPMHLAAALGKPGVAIFGPTDPARNGPYGGTFTVLRSPTAVTTYKRRDVYDPAMRDVSVGTVLESLKARLACPTGC